MKLGPVLVLAGSGVAIPEVHISSALPTTLMASDLVWTQHRLRNRLLLTTAFDQSNRSQCSGAKGFDFFAVSFDQGRNGAVRR